MKKLVLLLVIALATVCCNERPSGKITIDTKRLVGPKHNIILKWVGEDSTIPQDGTVVRILATKGDTIFLGKIGVQ
jgi:hypothetical protein